ncbi:MAG TPA: SPOR domain-containing protein [Bryobacteraceae bacterium]|nr:SPOR domain-containing protein [Bryobacteraceae bacterium]
MRNSETGEFELVVGNRQLLSGFFIVILLLAVTFAMGYVVGQNSPRSAKVQADAGTQPPPMTNAAESRPQPVQPVGNPPAAAAPVPAEGAAGAPADAGSAAPPAAPLQAEKAPAEKAAPPSAAAAPASGAPVTDPTPGSYWQVMALRQPDAEVMVRTLKDMGLPALMSPSPTNSTLMRVLVGPYNDTETMGRVKSQLENAGLHPIRNNLK